MQPKIARVVGAQLVGHDFDEPLAFLPAERDHEGAYLGISPQVQARGAFGLGRARAAISPELVLA